MMVTPVTRAATKIKFAFDSLANQRIVTVNELKVIEVSAPDDSSVELFIGGSSVGNMTNAGGGVFTYDWTPTSINHTGVTVEAVGDVSKSSNELLIVVAEANAINTDMSTWTKVPTSIAVTTGQADPFGGTGAFLFTPTVSSVTSITSPALSPAMTEPNYGLDIWVKSNGVEWFYFDGNQGYAIFNINTEQGRAVGCYVSVVESIGDWKRVWVRRANETTITTTTWEIHFRNSISTTGGFTVTGSDGAYFYMPRTVDAKLPLTVTQQLLTYKDTVDYYGAEAWQVYHPIAQTGEVVMDGSISLSINVIRPDGWVPNGNYKKLLLLPALNKTLEVLAGGTMIEELASTADYANTYNCVVIIPQVNDIWLYYGNRTDGVTVQLHTYVTEVVTYFAEKYLGCSKNGNLCGAIGYSKSANGAFSMQFLRPDKIGVACGWDGHWDQYQWYIDRGETNFSYTTLENSAYFDPLLNVENRVSSFNDRVRLVLLGGYIWNADTALMKAALDATGVDYQYSFTALTKHSYDAGWLDDAVERVMTLCVP